MKLSNAFQSMLLLCMGLVALATAGNTAQQPLSNTATALLDIANLNTAYQERLEAHKALMEPYIIRLSILVDSLTIEKTYRNFILEAQEEGAIDNIDIMGLLLEQGGIIEMQLQENNKSMEMVVEAQGIVEKMQEEIQAWYVWLAGFVERVEIARQEYEREGRPKPSKGKRRARV